MSAVAVGIFSAHPKDQLGVWTWTSKGKKNYRFLINFPMHYYNCWQLQLEH